MYMHVQRFSEGSEKAGDELRSTITGDMVRNSVLGEDVRYEDLGELLGGAGDCCQSEYGLLGEPINDYQNGVGAIRERKGFNVVHRDRIPRMRRNRELLENSVRLVELWL